MDEIMVAKTTEINDRELSQTTKQIITYMGKIKENYFKIAWKLKEVSDTELYKRDGYETVEAYVSAALGMSRRTYYNMVSLATKYLNSKGEPTLLYENPENGKCTSFTPSQYIAMLSLTREEAQELINEGIVTAEMSSRAIDKAVKARNAAKKLVKATEEDNPDLLDEDEEPSYEEALAEAEDGEFEEIDETEINGEVDMIHHKIEFVECADGSHVLYFDDLEKIASIDTLSRLSQYMADWLDSERETVSEEDTEE